MYIATLILETKQDLSSNVNLESKRKYKMASPRTHNVVELNVDSTELKEEMLHLSSDYSHKENLVENDNDGNFIENDNKESKKGLSYMIQSEIDNKCKPKYAKSKKWLPSEDNMIFSKNTRRLKSEESKKVLT